MTFFRFMELALYHSPCGYYERTSQLLGRVGDYYTSVSTGDVFGGLLACQFSRWLEPISRSRISLIEAGAHGGDLALDILRWLERNKPELLERLDYCIIEPSPTRRAWQKETLKTFAGKVRWEDSFLSFGQASVQGILFSNELLDAMPVHRLGWDAKESRWFEWGVTNAPDGFRWCRLPSPPLAVVKEMERCGLTWPEELLRVLPDEYSIEVSPGAARWWREAARSLASGILMTIDYGLETDQVLLPERTRGTLRAYARHRVHTDLLASPGEQDLTAHVNFSVLKSIGEAEGLITKTFVPQSSFLTEIVRREWQDSTSGRPWTDSQKRQFQTLTHPEHLGRAFKVLAQERAWASRGGSASIS